VRRNSTTQSIVGAKGILFGVIATALAFLLPQVAVAGMAQPPSSLLYIGFDEGQQLYVVPSTGGESEPIGEPGMGPDSFPDGDWSPDGTAIALVPPNSSDVVELYAPTGELLKTFRVDDARNEARFSPDGTTLVVPAGEEIGLYLVHIATGATRPVTSPPGPVGGDGDPQWSPDGAQIVFERSSQPFTVHVVDVATGEERFVAERQEGVRWRWTPNAELISLPDDVELSPDGSRRASSCTGAPPEDADTCANAVYVDGVKVFEGGAEPRVAWSPDGRRLSVLSRGLHVVDLVDGSSRRIADGLFTAAHFTPAGPRFAGASRIETAVSISRANYQVAATVILARNDDFADALGGAPLAGLLDAPLLLSGRDQVPPAVIDELRRLGSREVVLLGGEAALSGAVKAQLEGLGLTTRRVAGGERYATSSAIAREVLERGGADEVYVAAGRSFADALAVGSLAASTGRPIVLTEAERFPPESAETIAGLRTATVIGGPGAVSPAVEDDIDRAGVDTARIAGADRYGTSAEVLDASVGEGLVSGVWLATGRDFPDALAAAPAAAASGAQLLLVDGASLPPVSADALERHRAVLGRLASVGGPDVVGPATVQDVVGILSPG